MSEPDDPIANELRPSISAILARASFLDQLALMVREYPSWSSQQMISTPLLPALQSDFELLRRRYEALDDSDRMSIQAHWLEIARAQPGVNTIHYLLSTQYEYILDKLGLLNNAYAERNLRERTFVEKHNQEDSDKWTVTPVYPLIARIPEPVIESIVRIDDRDDATPTQPIRLVHDAPAEPSRPGPADAVPVEIDDGARVVDVTRWARRQKRIGLITGFGVASGLACAGALLFFFAREAPRPSVDVASTTDVVEPPAPRAARESGVSATRFLPTSPDAPLQVQTEDDLWTIDCKVTNELGDPVKTETRHSDDPERPGAQLMSSDGANIIWIQ